MKKIFYANLFLLIVVFGTLNHIEDEEWGRMAMPRSNVPAIRVDAAMLDADLAMFSSVPLASREVGSAGSKLAQDYIGKRFAQIGLRAFGASYALPFSFSRTHLSGMFKAGQAYREQFPSAVNVVGYISGSAYPERYIVVSARYDTHAERGPRGPDQWKANESGLATMLAMASYLAQHPPRNSIVFAAFDGEERGQAGAEQFLAHPPFPKQLIAVNLNLDIVGSRLPFAFYLAGTYHTPALAPLVEHAALASVQRIGLGHDRPFWRAGRIEDWTGVSDHRVFHANGIPFLFASIEEMSGPSAPPGKRAYEASHFEDGANFLTTLAMQLDQNLEALPGQKARD